MCGIAGYLGPKPLPRERIDAAFAKMKRRGPDGQDFATFARPDGSHVALLHSRLAIIDLDVRSLQPFRRDGIVLSYNGEIYDYIERKIELEKLGHRFTTTGDTEVFAAALRQWPGAAAFERLDGMWALASYDERDHSVLLARDRFGEKPLHFYRGPEGFFFASEPKILFALLGRALPINRRHLQRYLVNGYKSLYKTAETFFEGLRELRPGTLLRFALGSEPVEERWYTPRFDQEEDMTFEEAVAATRERLLVGVSRRLRADVPLAFCMSGGVDSNILISIAKNICNYDVQGFTIMNTDARYEEADLVAHAVEVQGLKHTAVSTKVPNGLVALRELVRQHDAPVYTISYFVHWLLMRAMHERGFKVSISGTGADELFTGYYDHHLAYLATTHGSPEGASHRRGWERDVKPIVRNPFLSNADYFVEGPNRRDHIFLDRDVFAETLTEPFTEGFTEESYSSDLLRNRMANELFAEAVPVIVHEDDINAMYYSIENRSPYLDHHLFELTARIPTRHLMRDGMGKVVLRESMRGIVPDRIIDSRRKVGFNAPITDVLDIREPATRDELLAPSPVFEVIKRSFVEELVAKDSLPNSRSKLLFYFICTKVFMEENA